MNGVDNSVETVNAAATAIIAAGGRVQQVTSPRRRWGGWLSMYWCFGTQRHDKRVNHSSFSRESLISAPGHEAPEIPIQPPSLVLPFVAPPSSPASFLPSDPSTAAHSPVGLFSLTALTADAYTQGGHPSIFSPGPYADDTRLVSPPVFSTFTTEPSSAPLTPPEPVHFTTPSSPEVPFAELLMSSLDSTLRKSEGQGFQSYQLYPGSPIGNLISPSSVCSGTSTPFPDAEFHSYANGFFSSFPIADPPKLTTTEGLTMINIFPLRSLRKDGSFVGNQISETDFTEAFTANSHFVDPILSQRVSFDLSNENITNCGSKKPEDSEKSATDPHSDMAEPDSTSNKVANEPANIVGCYVDEKYHDLPEKLNLSANDQAAKEFKFDNVEMLSNGDVRHAEMDTNKDWAFFPLKQPGII